MCSEEFIAMPPRSGPGPGVVLVVSPVPDVVAARDRFGKLARGESPFG
jgi:hypothetical protein